MNLLIVDDEYYSVESLRIKIEDKYPQFDRVFCAYNLKHAMEYFTQHEIAVMLCDIEMPGGSGLELLEEVRRLKLSTACIFLTAYAKFDYISQAMKLSSCDYLLKPVEDQALFAAVDKACDQYRKQKESIHNTLYADYWRESELYLMEQFWQDILAHTISNGSREIESELLFRKLNAAYASEKFILLMIQCHLDARGLPDKGLYEFTLKNIAREYFYQENELPVMVRISESFYVLLLPLDGRQQEQVVKRCSDALVDFVPHFPFTFNFFVSDQAYAMAEMDTAFDAIQREARNNVVLENHVFDLSKPLKSEMDAEKLPVPKKRWNDLILQNKFEQLKDEIGTYFGMLKASGTARRESLKSFYYSFLQMLFETIEKEQEQAVRCFREQLSDAALEQPFSSFDELKNWVAATLEIYKNSTQKAGEQSDVVPVVREYIRTHLYDELNRDMLAAMVFLNPDYLSHLFKKETGYSLTNYIIEERIQKAKQLLSRNDMSIRDIAIECGFQNTSYFSRQFKKSTGMTPREFRH